MREGEGRKGEERGEREKGKGRGEERVREGREGRSKEEEGRRGRANKWADAGKVKEGIGRREIDNNMVKIVEIMRCKMAGTIEYMIS